MVRDRKLVVTLIATLVFCGSVFAQTLYKYRGDDGEWIYADRPPPDGDDVEALSLKRHGGSGSLAVTHSVDGSGIQFVAINRFHAPVEVRLIFEMIVGVDYPHPDDELRWVVPARSELVLLDLSMLGSVDQPSIRHPSDLDPVHDRQPAVPLDAAGDLDDGPARLLLVGVTCIGRELGFFGSHRLRRAVYPGSLYLEPV